MNINDIFTVKIDKMINEGKGIARVGKFPVFIDNVCPEDIVKIRISKVNKNYAYGELIEITQPSQYRTKPKCPFHNLCGSCNWQHINYEMQLKQKRNIVAETIKNISGIDVKVEEVIPSPKIYEYRCKVQLPVSQTKVSKRLLSGYFKKNSHELINIKCCKLHNNIINEINEFFKETSAKYKISAYNEKTHKGMLRHIIYRCSSDLKQILIIFVINDNAVSTNLKKISDELINKYPNITGICANCNTKKSNVILSDKTDTISGNNYYIETLDKIKYKISSNSFFQVNPYCAKLMFNKVKELININNPSILDAYSGVSSFGIWLSSIAKKVVCIEEVVSASSDAVDNIKLNNINNIEIINGDAEKSFKKLINDGIKFDVSIIDPPRKGCSYTAVENLIKLTSKYIIYVSCNPSTLARDLKILYDNSFVPIIAQPIDMFPNTAHIETIVLFENKCI